MNKLSRWSRGMRLAAVFVLSGATAVCAAAAVGEARIASVRRIWASDRSNEFTDLIRYQNRWLCSFREGTKHESPDGTVRIFESRDGETWQQAAQLQEDGIDLRDPKFSITPDGRLMLVMGGSIMKNDEYVDRQTRVAFSADGRSWSPLHKILQPGDWLWRVTWFKGRAYGVSYLGGGGLRGVKRAGFLYRSDDGLKWDLITKLDLPGASETTLRFLETGEMIALSRSTVAGLGTRIGSSFAPYEKWIWKDFPQDLGGPNFIVLPDGRWVAATRFRLPDGQSRTKLAWLTRDRLDFFLEFESKRSTSYPGLVWHDGKLWVSYHSSHETKTSSIYVAQVELPPRSQEAAGLPRAAPDNSTAAGITWLVQYDGKSLPQQQGWTALGDLAAGASLIDGALRIKDDSTSAMGCFRAPWTPDPTTEVVVEATVRVETMGNGQRGDSMYPTLEGAPIGLLISDGHHQDGLALRPGKVNTFIDREAWRDTRDRFHVYRLVIQGNDLRVEMDGERVIRGEGAFSQPAESGPAFVQFGSNSAQSTGESHWKSVRLGIRKKTGAPEKPRLRITLGKPWDIPPLPPGNEHLRPYGIIKTNTRPFVHDLGRGLLLMTVGQGPDAKFEPYGVFRSLDAGKSWTPVRDLQYKSFTPQSFVRLRDGTIFGLSRWTTKYLREDGVFIGMSYRLDPQAERFTMFENMIRVPAGMGWTDVSRDLFDLGNGEMLASVYCAAPGGRQSFLIRSADGGATWEHFSTIGHTAEPSVVRLSATDMTAVLRHRGPMLQTWSVDRGKTWSEPVTLEERGVDPDMVMMSHGVLACSYGRPGSNLMFSLDRGRTWMHHRTITDQKGFNYAAIREVSPGRLLYVHDAPRLQALYVDVERLD